MRKLILLALLLPLTPALADGMRCGNLLVLSGDRKERVLERCGEPDDIETSVRFVKRHSAFSKDKVIHEITTERWYYDFGGGLLPKVLVFENGILIDVDVVSDR